MILQERIVAALDLAERNNSIQSDRQRAHLYAVRLALSGTERVVAGTKPLNRYSLQPGKIFARSTNAKEKFKVLRVLADDVVVQDLSTQRIKTYNVNQILKEWAEAGLMEVSLLDSIIRTVKEVLGPSLGIFLTSALIAWLIEKLR